MITNEAKRDVSLVNIQGQKSMGMKVTSKSFSLLIDKLYMDKPGAVVREIGSNARDAMVMAGKGHLPFTIHIPNNISSELVFEDNGVGMTRDEAEKYLNTLFESNKEESNDAIGAYGLGSKSPFSVTDNFIVETRKNGTKHIFNFFRDGSNTPQLLHIAEVPWDGEDGVTFRIPSSPAMYETYKKSIAAQMFFFEPKPEIAGLYDHSGLWDDYGSVIYENDTHTLINSYGLKNRYGALMVVMGGVTYPVDLASLARYTNHEWTESQANQYRATMQLLHQRFIDIAKGLSSNACIAIKCKIGELSVPPSREMLEYDSLTFHTMLSKLDAMTNSFHVDFVEYLISQFPPGDIEDFVEFGRKVAEFREIYDWHRTRSGYGEQHDDRVAKLLSKYKWTYKYDSVFGDIACHDLNGKAMEYHIEIDIADPTAIDRRKNASMPFSISKKIEKSTVAFTCTADGEFLPNVEYNPGSLKSMFTSNSPQTQQQYLESLEGQGWKVVNKGEAVVAPVYIPVEEATSGEEQTGYIMRFEFEREYQVIDPVYKVATNTRPGHEKVLPDAPMWTDWRTFKLDRLLFDGKQREIWLLLDKDINIGRTVSWYMREMAAKVRFRTDTPSYAQVMHCNPRDCSASVVLIRSRDHHFKHIEAMVEHYTQAGIQCPEIVLGSSIVIGKPEKVSMGQVSLRGIRVLNLSGEEYNTPQFQAVSASGHDELKPGVLLYSDGNKSTIYTDVEMTNIITMNGLVKMAKMLKFTTDASKITFYLLTPSRHKDTEKLVELGNVYIGDILKNKVVRQYGYNIRRQFKRRLVHYIKKVEMSNALRSDTKRSYQAHDLEKDFRGRTLSFLTNHAPNSKYTQMAKRALALHLKKGMCGWQHDDDLSRIDYLDLETFLNRYKKHYGKVTVEEAIGAWVYSVKGDTGGWFQNVKQSVQKWIERMGVDAVNHNLKDAYLNLTNQSPLYHTVKQEVAKRL